MIVNIDGHFVAPDEARLPVNDGAVLFGDTLFETMLARGRTIRLLEAHLERLGHAAALLGLPFERARTETALLATAARLTAPVSRLRLTLSRGTFKSLAFPSTEAARFIITAAPYHEPADAERAAGVACVFAPNRRTNPLSHLPQMKRGNYADCLYAAAYAHERGAREALFVTADDKLLEGATSNLFLRHGRTLVTAEAGDLVLPGIMRRQVLDAAGRLGLAIEVRDVTVAELYEADEAFLTNALVELLPVASVEGRPVALGTETVRLLAATRSPEYANKAENPDGGG